MDPDGRESSAYGGFTSFAEMAARHEANSQRFREKNEQANKKKKEEGQDDKKKGKESNVVVIPSPHFSPATIPTVPPGLQRLGLAAGAAWVGWQLGPWVAEHFDATVEGFAQILEKLGVDSEDLRGPEALNSASQDKMLTPGEIGKLEDAGIDVHELKGGKRTGQIDLYKRPNGDIVIKPKGGGKMSGEETGYNIKDL